MDPTIERVLALRRVDIFATLSYDSLVELAGLVRTRTEPAGAVLVAAGSVGYELYAITSGAVEVRGSGGTLTRLEAGTVFGELAVVDPAPRSATVVAVTPVELLVVPRSTVLALADRRPAVMAEIARVLARRLRVSS
jgi:CRP-like cAMP-binding protein